MNVEVHNYPLRCRDRRIAAHDRSCATDNFLSTETTT